MLWTRKTRHDVAAGGILVAFLAVALALLTTTADGAENETEALLEGAEIGQPISAQKSCPAGCDLDVARPAGQIPTLAFAGDSRAAVDGCTVTKLQRCARGARAGGPTIEYGSVSPASPVDAGSGNCHVTSPADILKSCSQASAPACARTSGLRPAERRVAWQLLPAIETWSDAEGD